MIGNSVTNLQLIQFYSDDEQSEESSFDPMVSKIQEFNFRKNQSQFK